MLTISPFGALINFRSLNAIGIYFGSVLFPAKFGFAFSPPYFFILLSIFFLLFLLFLLWTQINQSPLFEGQKHHQINSTELR